METLHYQIGQSATAFFFGVDLHARLEALNKEKCVLITDENVYKAHTSIFDGFFYVVIAPGEENKIQKTVDDVIQKLLDHQMTSQHVLVGVGGGVVTDIAGFVASIFKRGMPLILAPTSVLAIVDAALGGKNGINVGRYKNMLGTVYQPKEVWFDPQLLSSLPVAEWINGCAEIIKHAWIADEDLLALLEKHDIDFFRNETSFLYDIIKRNVKIKMDIVIQDPLDKKQRRWLNFGHTIGHAIEKQMNIPHGHAVSIGMVIAAKLSHLHTGLPFQQVNRMISLLKKYQLPVDFNVDIDALFDNLLQDKKREGDTMNFILLQNPGKPVVTAIQLSLLHNLLKAIIS